MMPLPLRITAARVISGAGRGRRLGIPTINIDPSIAPNNFSHGVYACLITIAGKRYQGAMHYGPRPVFRDSLSLEVHVLDATIDAVPENVDLTVVERIRDIADFPSTEALMKAIERDITLTRAMLKTYEKASEKAHP